MKEYKHADAEFGLVLRLGKQSYSSSQEGRRLDMG